MRDPRNDSLPDFEYIFTRDGRIKEVRQSSTSYSQREKIFKEGKVHRPLDPTYLEDLKKGVRYWDGEKWTKEPVRVHIHM